MDRSFWTLTAGTGALRPEHIRTDASNEECSKFLEEAFHAGQTQPDLDGEDSEESDAEGGKICHMLCGGLCQSSSKTASVCKMVAGVQQSLARQQGLHGKPPFADYKFQLFSCVLGRLYAKTPATHIGQGSNGCCPQMW